MRFNRLRFAVTVPLAALWGSTALAGPVGPGPVAAGSGAAAEIPVVICADLDACAAGEGLLGDAPAAMAREAEADFGEGTYEPPSEPEYPEYEYEGRDSDSRSPVIVAPVIDSTVDTIELAVEECSRYDPIWRVDCLTQMMRLMAQRLPSEGDYGALKQDFAAAAAKLDKVVVGNADRAVPPQRFATEVRGKRRTTPRPLRAIAPARQAAANAAAAAVLDELSTRLLRSADTSGSQRVHFERAAAAVGSAKVLLRSS